MNLYLCGMIGAGKSAIGLRLAARLGRPFFDLDREMDRQLGGSFHTDTGRDVEAEAAALAVVVASRWPDVIAEPA